MMGATHGARIAVVLRWGSLRPPVSKWSKSGCTLRNPDTSGPHWYCDVVAISFQEGAGYLCEITCAARAPSLLGLGAYRDPAEQ